MTICHVFIDESGDLGFTSKSSRHFVTAYLIVQHPDLLRRSMRRLLKRSHEKGKYPRGAAELKFSKANAWVRNKVFEETVSYAISIGEIVLKKWKVVPYLKEKISILYNYVVVHLVEMILPSLDSLDKLELNLDRCMSGFQAQAFSEYSDSKVSYLWQNRLLRTDRAPEICVIQPLSETEPCIQAADFVAGAIFNKYERGNDTYYSILEKSGKMSPKILWP